MNLKESVMIRTCSFPNCTVKEEYNGQRWIENWMKYNDGFICKKHYDRLHAKKYNSKQTYEYKKKYNDKWNPIINKIYNPINNPKNNPRRMLFQTKTVLLVENPRKGQCSFCGKRIGDEYINHKGEKDIIKKTDMHHINYNDSDPLKDTMELCASCHGKTKKLKKEILK